MNADTFNAAQEAIATAAQHAHKGMPGSAALCLQDARLAPGTRVTYGKWDGVIVRHEFDTGGHPLHYSHSRSSRSPTSRENSNALAPLRERKPETTGQEQRRNRHESAGVKTTSIVGSVAIRQAGMQSRWASSSCAEGRWLEVCAHSHAGMPVGKAAHRQSARSGRKSSILLLRESSPRSAPRTGWRTNAPMRSRFICPNSCKAGMAKAGFAYECPPAP